MATGTLRPATFEWIIPRFRECIQRSERIYSPDFHLPDSTWYLELDFLPFDQDFLPSYQRIIINLLRRDSGEPKTVTYEIKINLETRVEEIKNTSLFDSRNIYCLDYLTGFKKNVRDLLIRCYIKVDTPHSVAASKKMRNDFKSLLVSGENSDVTLVVGGKKFPAHRNILCARSPVFKAMLCHDTAERISGTVSIDDCDPDKFMDFLIYVYTGSTLHIDPGNAISLYHTSDKYLMGELKEACVSFMKANMSVDGFCVIAILALRHEEKELLESLTKFFCENAKEISETENWVTFFKDNPNDAYEHFMKPLISRRRC